MLSQLYIENIAVIRQATIDFQQGFHVFTGETGAGKTILISAINAVLDGPSRRSSAPGRPGPLFPHCLPKFRKNSAKRLKYLAIHWRVTSF